MMSARWQSDAVSLPPVQLREPRFNPEWLQDALGGDKDEIFPRLTSAGSLVYQAYQKRFSQPPHHHTDFSEPARIDASNAFPDH